MSDNIRIVWKVHRRNFRRFISYVDDYFDKYNYYTLDYDKSHGEMYRLYEYGVCDYLLIGLATSDKNNMVVSCERYDYKLLNYIISCGWENKGEYEGRKEKLERLNKLSDENGL